MKKLKILLPVIAFLFSVNNLVAQSSGFPDYVPTIPADRRVDWHNVGDKQQPSGQYNVNFNASKLSSGIYLYRITANGFTAVKKMILTK